MADALGVRYQTVGYLERGEYSPSLHLALRIAEYIEVSVEVVFPSYPFPSLGQQERTAVCSTRPGSSPRSMIRGGC